MSLFSPFTCISLSIDSNVLLSVIYPSISLIIAFPLLPTCTGGEENTRKTPKHNRTPGPALSLPRTWRHSPRPPFRTLLGTLSRTFFRGTSGHSRPSASEALALQHSVRTRPRNGEASSWMRNQNKQNTKRLRRTQDFWSIEGFSLSTPPILQTQTLPPHPSPCTLHMILQHATPSCIATGIVDSGFPRRLITPSGASPALRRARKAPL